MDILPAQVPPRPKIVVFGASGKIGRRIIKKLMSASGVDMDVVAFVRNKQKFDAVLYDEEDLVLGNLLDEKQRSRGPRLSVVVGDVVARTDVYRGTFETAEETKVLNDWVMKAREFFRIKGWISGDGNSTISINSLQDHDQVKEDVRIIEAGDEALHEAVSGATIIISCLSSVRYSNLWTDYLQVPILRVFRNDASKWCADVSHPYYINFLSTKKILEVAEREQLKRDAYNEFERERLLLEEQLQRGRTKMLEEEEGFDSKIADGLRLKRSSSRERNQYVVAGDDTVDLPKNGVPPSSTDRIKFIRISNSMVGRNPFRILTIFTNVFRSQVSRFEYLGEKLLEESQLIDTIILRPGEVTDIERDCNNTSLQVCINGDVPTPNLGLVGRDDIADLAVVAALTKTSLDGLLFSTTTTTTNGTESKLDSISSSLQNHPHHYTWSLRWTGEGLSTAALCFVKAIKYEMKLSRIRKMKENKLTQYHGGTTLLALQKWRRRMRPHALSVALAVYLTLGVTTWYFFGSAIVDLALRGKHKLLLRFFS